MSVVASSKAKAAAREFLDTRTGSDRNLWWLAHTGREDLADLLDSFAADAVREERERLEAIHRLAHGLDRVDDEGNVRAGALDIYETMVRIRKITLVAGFDRKSARPESEAE